MHIMDSQIQSSTKPFIKHISWTYNLLLLYFVHCVIDLYTLTPYVLLYLISSKLIANRFNIKPICKARHTLRTQL